MDAIRFELQLEHDRDTLAGVVSTFDPNSPWDMVWENVVSDGEYWRQTFEVPAMLIRTGAPQASFVQGDALIGTSFPSAPCSSGMNKLGQPRQPKSFGQPSAGSNLGIATPGSLELCRDFNLGRCVLNPKGECPGHASRRHACSKCGSPKHGAHQCQKGGGKDDHVKKNPKKSKKYKKDKWGKGS
jgi:hypothetical protein